MATPDPKDDLISIRCSSCGSRFEVREELIGRIVECARCKNRFRASAYVSHHGTKYYPGERRDPLLDQVSKVDKPLPAEGDPSLSDSYANHALPNRNEPLPPQRVMAGALAALTVIITALILVIGASHDGVLSGVSIGNRVVFAAFAALLATLLLVYANARAWLLMLLLGVVMGGILVSLPVFFQGGSRVLGDPSRDQSVESDRDPSADGSSLSDDELRDLIGTKPLEKERRRLLETPTSKTALGLWLRNLEERNRLLIKDYLIREMNAAEETHFYPRGKGDFLVVVTGIGPNLNQLAAVAEPLGSVRHIHKSLHIVEVSVDNSNFKSGPIDKLTEPTHPEFYALNAIELKSIDLDRVSAAVRRLSEAEPALLRDDIEKRLIQLLENDWFENKEDASRALLVWAKDKGRAGKVALEQAVILHQNEQEVPSEMIALCIKQDEMDVLPLLYELWKINPSRWEPWFREAGAAAEKTVLLGFDSTTGMLRQSACRILGRIGGELSLPVLRVTASTASDKETRIVAGNSVQQIEKRLAAGESP